MLKHLLMNNMISMWFWIYCKISPQGVDDDNDLNCCWQSGKSQGIVFWWPHDNPVQKMLMNCVCHTFNVLGWIFRLMILNTSIVTDQYELYNTFAILHHKEFLSVVPQWWMDLLYNATMYQLHISHNAPFCNRNIHMSATLPDKMVHCGIKVFV